MKPRSSTATPAERGADRTAVGAASHRHQHRVEDVAPRAALALEGDAQAVGPGLDRRRLGLEQDLFVALLQALGERRDDVAVRAGNELVHHFDDGDLRAQRVIDRRHLQPDDAAAEDQQPLGREFQLERAGRIPDARIARDEAGRRRLRTGGDDRGVKRIVRWPSAVADGERMGRGERALAGDDRHLALARQAGQPRRQALDDALLPAAQSVEIDARRRKDDAVRGHLRRLVDDFSRMQQRLGRYAADVEANAAERRPPVDQDDALAEIGGAEGRGVAARPGAEDEDVAFEVDLRRRGRRRRLLDGRSRPRPPRRPRRTVASSAPLLTLSPTLTLTSPMTPGFRRGHFERRLVAFERQDDLFLGDGLPGLDVQFDDRHVLEVADIGKPDFTRHGLALRVGRNVSFNPLVVRCG